MKKKYLGGLFALFFVAVFSYIGNKPTVMETPYFPSPDPTKGISLGYDFNKKAYYYHPGTARECGVNIPEPKKKRSTLDEAVDNYIEDNREEILDHLQN